MSLEFNETPNYIWNTKYDCLGEGSFGKIFLAINRLTGETVAVKTFKNDNQEITEDMQREMQMLQTLHHKYIIQLLAVEREKNTEKRVLIIEYCNGGNLLQFLNEPENVNGLVDEEFLLVIKHLTEGLEYLNKNNVIHRDVKPGNIMRHVQVGGEVIYKLADFGTARQLPEGENFTSIHGTPHYLHPRMYRVRYFGDQSKREFDCNTDLWSIGVTLYQISSGSLPFRVKNISAMLTIFDEMMRTEGIISATQENHNSRPNFSRNLPSNSRLSSGLMQLVTPVIAGLFIHDDIVKQWSFKKYYEEVEKILARKVIKILYINTLQIITVYIGPEEDLEHFQDYVYQQTGISKKNQGFFYKQKWGFSSVKNFPGGITDLVYLYDKTTHVIMPIMSKSWPDLSDFLNNFSSESYSDSCRRASGTCQDIGICKQLVENQAAVYNGFNNFARDFGEYFKAELEKQRKLYNDLLEQSDSIGEKINVLKKIESVAFQSNNFKKQYRAITKNLAPRASKLFDNLQALEDSAPQFTDISYDYYLKVIVKELTDMKGLRLNLIKERGDHKYYDVEKIKIRYCVSTVRNILNEKVRPQFDIFVQQIEDWYENTFYQRLKALQLLKKLLHDEKRNLKKMEGEVQRQINKNLDYKLNNKDTELIIEENAKLMNQINEYALFDFFEDKEN